MKVVIAVLVGFLIYLLTGAAVVGVILGCLCEAEDYMLVISLVLVWPFFCTARGVDLDRANR